MYDCLKEFTLPYCILKPDHKLYPIAYKNFKQMLVTHTIIVDSTILDLDYIKIVDNLQLLFEHVSFPVSYLEKWFMRSLQAASVRSRSFHRDLFDSFVTYISQYGYLEQFTKLKKIILYILSRPDLIDTYLDMVIEASGWNQKLRWVDGEKLFGLYCFWDIIAVGEN